MGRKKEVFTNTLLMIDSSYLSFYRFYATMRWYSLAYKEEMEEIHETENYNWFENEIFMEKYKKMYFMSLDKIRKTYKISSNNILFVFDCPRDKIWRNQHYNAYKSNRDTEKHKRENISEVFRYTYNTIFPQLENLHNVKTIKIERAEADDVIAVIKKNVRKKLPNRKIVIVTNDNDYLQLADDNTTLINMNNKILTEKSRGNPKDDLLAKIICGDNSDTIPQIFKKCGPKTVQKYLDNPELLEERLNAEPESKKKFEFNKLLIDFDMIPENIQKNITEKFNKLNMIVEDESDYVQKKIDTFFSNEDIKNQDIKNENINDTKISDI